MVIGLDNGGKTSVIDAISRLNPRNQKSEQTQQQTNSKQKSSPSFKCMNNTDNRSQSSQLTRPTVGYNFERIFYGDGITINILDFSGNSRYRDLWQEFYCGVDGIVFVIDSSDPIRFVVARDELDTMLTNRFFNSLDRVDTTLKELSKPTSTTKEPKRIPPVEIQKELIISNDNKLIETPLDTSRHGAGGRRSNMASDRRRSGRSQVPILFLANKCDSTDSTDTVTISKALDLNKLNTKRHPWHIQATSVKTGQGLKDALGWLIGRLST